MNETSYRRDLASKLDGMTMRGCNRVPMARV